MFFSILLCLNTLLILAYATLIVIYQKKNLNLSNIIRILFLTLFALVAFAHYESEQQFIIMLCLWVVFEALNLKKLNAEKLRK